MGVECPKCEEAKSLEEMKCDPYRVPSYPLTIEQMLCAKCLAERKREIEGIPLPNPHQRRAE